ncbi:MAG: F0F1 ATP synthase subunit delta [Planctomycetaceae bacterium]|nr:F0F1 ATP synthase subunit delta [Planctomycetaceae bacterium]
MARIKLEYIWLDGYEPTPNLRGKTKMVDGDPASFTLADCPMWGFDGSSTRQAEGRSSDCMLKPVALYPDATRQNGFIVLAEVMMPDGATPHPSNARATIPDDPGLWIGLEQEYFLFQDNRPLGWPDAGYPDPQGEYYCGVGAKQVGDLARAIVEEHLDVCIAAGINHEGINAEVAKGQWEFQIFGKGACTAADQVWVARYLLMRICEKYGVDVVLHCKPFQGDWNGSGMHCNFSTEHMRTKGGKEYFESLMAAFEKYRDEAENRVHAYVQAGSPFNEAEKEALKQSLRQASGGKDVVLHYEDQPELLGGARVRLGDLVVDTTLKRRLSVLARKLA